MKSVPCAVIGVGYLGRFHAQKYAALPQTELIGVVDTDPEQAQRVADETQTQAFTDYRELLGKVEAVSIVVPTTLHFAVARDFLESGAHVLVEKPITTTTEEAKQLIDLAKARDRVLQVGHLERFNPALMALTEESLEPLFIESHRLAPFKPRATDVDVVLDLMIHDIDIILNMLRSPITDMAVSGACVLSNAVDIANARLAFANGCVANITASRVSQKTMRKMRIFQKQAYFAVDFQNRELARHSVDPDTSSPDKLHFDSQTRIFDSADALMAEIEAFLAAIHGEAEVIVSGEDGLRALQAAHDITQHLAKNVTQLTNREPVSQ